MRLAISPAIASVLLMLATAAPSLAWGADGVVDVLRASSLDMKAFDAAIGQARTKDTTARSSTKATVGVKVQAEARKLHDQRESDIQDRKSFGQWVKSNSNPSGGQGSAATVGDEGSGTGSGSSSSTARGNSGKGKGKGSGGGNGSN